MNRRPAPLLALASLALLVALGMYLGLTGGSDAGTAPGPEPVGVRRADPSQPGSPSLGPRTPSSLPEADLASPRLAAGHGSGSLDLLAASWIEGRVRSPLGAPADPDLAILAHAALDAPPSRGPRAPGRSPLERMRDLESRGRPFAFLPVAADGTFRVPHRPDAAQVHLHLLGRFLYLPEPVEVQAGSAAVELEPLLGGALRLRLRAPAGVSPAALAGAPVELRSGSADDLGFAFGMGAGDRPQAALAAGEGLEVEFGGLDPARVYGLAYDGGSVVPWSERGLRVEPGRVRVVEGELLAGATLRGRVTGPDGAPLEGAQVRVRPQDETLRWLYGEGRRASSAADGTFELMGVRPTRAARVQASLEGWLPADQTDLELVDGGELVGLELRLAAGLSIEGLVRGRDGSPRPGARVTVRGGPGAAGQEVGAANADAEGRFRVTGLAEGRYTVTARSRPTRRLASAPPPAAAGAEAAPAGDPDPDSPALERAEVRSVPAGGPFLELVLAPGPGLSGRVVDAAGQAVPRFRARAGQGNESFDGRFDDPSGTFELEGPFAGTWTVRVEAEGHVQIETLSVEVPQTEALVIRLERAARLSGRVVDPDGRPAAGAQVSLRHGAGRTGMFFGGGGAGAATARRSISATSDAQGHFDLDDVAPGDARLSATHGAWSASEEQALELAPGVPITDLTLALRRGGTVEGRIFDGAGQPDAGRVVMAMGGAGSMPASATSDAQGAFRLERLVPGRYQVMAQPSRTGLERALSAGGSPGPADFLALMQTASVEVAEGQTALVVLGAPPAAPVRVFGRVSRGGAPVAGGSVMALVEGRGLMEGWKAARIGPDGSYELVLDEPGDLVLTVEAEARERGPRGGFGGGTQFPVEVPAVESFRFDLELPTGRVAGRVLGPDGQPLVSQRLRLRSEARPGSPLGRMEMTSSDAEGRFAFGDLAAGTYELQAGGLAVGSRSHGTALLGGIVLAEGGVRDDLILRLSEPGQVEGRVLGADGRPVDGATVHVRDANGSLLTGFGARPTGADGRFHFDGLGPGEVFVLARSAGASSPDVGPVRVRPGEATQVELVLAPGTSLRVVVEDAAGEPVRAALRVLDAQGHDQAGALPQEAWESLLSSGFSSREQRFGPLTPGRYTIVASAADQTLERTVHLRGDGERTVTLRLRE